jgi:hypothetical protein
VGGQGRQVVSDTSVFLKMSVDSDALQYGCLRNLSSFSHACGVS